MASYLPPLLALFLLPVGVACAQMNATPVQGQGRGSQPGNELAMKINDFTGHAAMVGRSKSPSYGSPYADHRWLPAQLVTTANVTLPIVILKYDVVNHRLLMRSPERPNDSLQLDDRTLVSFMLEEPATANAPARRRLFRRFLEAREPGSRSEYVEVLHDGKYPLLKRYVKKLHRVSSVSGFERNPGKLEMADKVFYYIASPGESAKQVGLTLKGLQQALPELAGAIAAIPGATTAKTEAELAALLDKVDPR